MGGYPGARQIAGTFGIHADKSAQASKSIGNTPDFFAADQEEARRPVATQANPPTIAASAGDP